MIAFAPDLRLTGEGLVLRGWTDDDLPAMAELFDDPDIAYRTPLVSPFDAAAARAYLDRAREEAAAGLRLRLAITTDGVRPLGEVLLIRQDADGPGASLGYTVGAAHRGQGLAARALRVLTHHAHGTLGLPRVTLSIEPDNEASNAVARAAGYRPAEDPPAAVVNKGRALTLRTWVHDSGAEEDVWAALTSMYAAHVTGNRDLVDSFLHPDVTIWDSDVAELLRGMADLNRARDLRPATAEDPVLTPYGEVIDVDGDLAVCRHWLRVDGEPRRVRNTAVLRRTRPDGPWHLVHLHEDVHGDGQDAQGDALGG